MLWIQFLIGAGIIVLAGIKLTKCADILSERLNIGKVWVGVLLLGVITSLPEAIASLTAVISLDAADLAVGNLIGSCNWNILLLALMDILYRREAITNRIHARKSHYVSMGITVAIVVVAVFEILTTSRHRMDTQNVISLGSIAIIILFLMGMRRLARLSSKEFESSQETHAPTTLPRIYLTLFVSGTAVVLSSAWLANVCDQIAVTTPLGRTFVGSLFLALATSLPEMVVTVSALRINALDMAFGNIFGSNMTNLAFLGVCDFFSKRGTIFSMSPRHLISFGLCLVLTGITFVGIRMKKKKIILNMGWDSILMIAAFVIGLGWLYWSR